MSILTALAAVRMQEKELLRTRCDQCGHRLSDHRISAPLFTADPERMVGNPACVGELRGGNRPRCKCKGFADPEEQ